MPQSKEYRNSQWFAFRNHLLSLDGAACQRCGRGAGEGVVLQVHHKRYLPGRQPWEYDFHDCETICQRCHAEAHGRIMPHTGWEYLGQDDLGDLSGGCEYCGHPLRYIFHIYHSHWGSLVVGTNCCDTLTKTDAASVYARRQRSREGRAARFVKSPRWQLAAGGHTIKQGEFTVQIVPAGGGYKIVINNTVGRLHFATLTEAKVKVFEVIESGLAGQYFKSRGKAKR